MVVVRSNLLEVGPERSQHFDVTPVETGGHDQRVERTIGRALLVEGADRITQGLSPIDHRGNPFRRVLDLVPVHVAFLV